MAGILIFILVILVITILFLIPTTSVKSKQKIASQKETSEKVLEKLKEQGFNVTKIFYLKDNRTWEKESIYDKIIICDSSKGQVCFIDYENLNVAIMPFNKVKSYKVEEKTEKINTEKYQDTSGVWRRKKTLYKDVKLIIKLESNDNPRIIYDIISNTSGIVHTSNKFKAISNSLQEATIFLDNIISKNKGVEVVDTTNTQEIKSKLNDLKEMLYAGLINDKEYDEKRKQILGLHNPADSAGDDRA